MDAALSTLQGAAYSSSVCGPDDPQAGTDLYTVSEARGARGATADRPLLTTDRRESEEEESMK